MKFDYDIILNKQQDSKHLIHAELALVESMDVFSGHFSKFPILPAVAQLYFVEKIAQQKITKLGSFAGMNQVKFMAPILPNRTVQIQMELDELKNSLKFQYLFHDVVKSKGIIKYHSKSIINSHAKLS